jgi:peptidoglycan hydrolase-like protein with peptidoglycan-binding domain
MPRESNPETPASPPTVSNDTSVRNEPLGVEDVREMQTTVGAASGGVLIEEDLEQARLRVYDAQVILTELGYLSTEHGALAVDGTWGPDTRDAIAAFQEDHDMPRTGQLAPDTYEALLAAHESALEPKSGMESTEDDFNPVHPERPLGD